MSFSNPLSADNWSKPAEGHFMYYLMLENSEVEKLIADVRPYIKMFLKPDTSEANESLQKLRGFIGKVKEYQLHYVKKENILFPYLEKTFTQHRCLQLMWSFHDDFRRSVKALERLLQSAQPDVNEVNTDWGSCFLLLCPYFQGRTNSLSGGNTRPFLVKYGTRCLSKAKEVGWCYGVKPQYSGNSSEKDIFNGLVNLGSGFLKPEQIILLLNNLPVDITFVDENDEVCYFQKQKIVYFLVLRLS